MYCDDDMLMLSGIQHFRFCPRQWALIHMEQRWSDNYLTTEGQIQHKHVDDPYYRQKVGEIVVLRSVSLASYELGLYGKSDAVELIPSDNKNNSISHPKYPGRWLPIPVEYKHGKPKNDEIDEVQLAAQAMCLEEMYSIRIQYGAIFYWEARHRLEVEFTPELRQIVKDCAKDMHDIFYSRRIPNSRQRKNCSKCSLYDVCLPQMEKCSKVETYLKNNLSE